MEPIKMPIKKRVSLLALGAESSGIFAVYHNSNIFISENFGDLLDESNFLKYKKAILDCLNRQKIKPDVIITDLHPLYKTTVFGEELARKFKTPYIKVQHHIAHIFSAVGDRIINAKRQTINDKRWNFNFNNSAFSVQRSAFFGIAMDGTGYGLDGNIWGGEIFKITNVKLQMTNKIQNLKSKIKNQNLNSFIIERVGSLEEQIMIGGDLAVRESARMLIAILNNVKCQMSNVKNISQNSKLNNQKEFAYRFVKKYYTRNEFELLYNQLRQNFNCQKTTSTGRILDAASVLLGFAGNERNFKHEATKLLEKNSTIPYNNIELIINSPVFPLCKGGSRGILQTTPLFEYLIKNINRDKKRLAATAQKYIADGFYKIIKIHDSKFIIHDSCFAAGGLSNNKIISSYLEKQGVYLSKKIPRGDEGIAVGQVIYCLLNNFH